MFMLTRPGEAVLENALAKARQQPLTYEPVGLARDHSPEGFRSDEARAVLGYGDAVFERALVGLAEWRQFDLGWVDVYPKMASLTPGTVVAVIAHHVGFWSVNCCRIVYLLPAGETVPGNGDRPASRVAGFAYGTLQDHAEAGEETFEIAISGETGEVTYRIRAVSRERALLAKLGFLVTRALQDRFRRDSVAALQRFVAQIQSAGGDSTRDAGRR